METLIIIVVVLAVLVAAVVGWAATKPDRFRVQRSATVHAKPEPVFALINDFHQWELWSPWEKLDPTMKKHYSGAVSGAGAIYEWEGNKKVGKGRMEITDALPPHKITIKLDFLKPFSAHNVTEFVLASEGESTHLIWAMQGSQPFMFKVMGLFVNVDKMIGKDFEAGLASIKHIAEKSSDVGK